MSKKRNAKEKIRRIWNVVMAVLVLYAWLIMFFNTKEGVLTSKGITNLKYYTTLSNILAAVVAAAWIVGSFAGNNKRTVAVWKLTAASAVGVTFLVVIGFLGPLYGFGGMYRGSNFFLHLVVPLLAMAEYVLFNDEKMSAKDNLFAMLPPLVYGTYYIINTWIGGVKGNDIYGFLQWGYPVGLLLFGVICIVAYGIGWLLRFANDKRMISEDVQSLLREQIPFDPETQYAVIRCSICTGERVAGFKDKTGGHFTEVMYLRTPEDEKRFREIYGLEEVKTEY